MQKNISPWLLAFSFALAIVVPSLAWAQGADKPFSNAELDALTAQIALYPDSLLSQVLMAATYPEDVAAAAKWSRANSESKGDEAVRMVANEPWDTSVQSLVAFPEVIITMGERPEWVRDLGDAFLAQPEDVMDSVQRLRQLAQNSGNLKSNEQITVIVEAPPPQTIVVQQSAPPPQVIVIQPAQPQVVFVPVFSPMTVFWPWPHPAFPPVFIPPPPGFWFSRTVSVGIAWGVGIGVSNALWGGVNWRQRNVNINVTRYNNINVNRRLNVNGNRTTWNHNPERRGKVPYRGGDAMRQRLNNRYQSGNREAYRGRDASREQAARALQNRLGDGSRDAARDRAQSVNRDAARQRAQNVDRTAAQQRAQAGNRDNALRGANSGTARAEMNRGVSSRQAAQQRPQLQNVSGGGRAQTPRSAGGGGGGARFGGGGSGRQR